MGVRTLFTCESCGATQAIAADDLAGCYYWIGTFGWVCTEAPDRWRCAKCADGSESADGPESAADRLAERAAGCLVTLLAGGALLAWALGCTALVAALLGCLP